MSPDADHGQRSGQVSAYTSEVSAIHPQLVQRSRQVGAIQTSGAGQLLLSGVKGQVNAAQKLDVSSAPPTSQLQQQARQMSERLWSMVGKSFSSFKDCDAILDLWRESYVRLIYRNAIQIKFITNAMNKLRILPQRYVSLC